MLDVAPGLVHESGPIRDRDWAPGRVAVMAHWSTDPEPSRSVVETLRALASAGYETLLVSAAETPAHIGRVCSWAPGGPALPDSTTILRRANVGYDFGSWAAVLAAFPRIRVADRVLLVNDSVVGPLSPLGPVLADFDSGPEPVWGLVASSQHRRHLQSFFVGFAGGVLDQPALRAFWGDVRVESRKSKVVRYNELGLAEALDEANIRWRAMLDPGPTRADNPTLDAPVDLIEAGMPFAKQGTVPGALHEGQGPDDSQHRQWMDGVGWRPVGDPADVRGLRARLRWGRFHLDVEGPIGAARSLVRRAR